MDSTAGFSAWVERLNGEAHVPTENGKTYQCIYRWIVDGSAVVGGIALRQGDHPLILTAGHVGYGIRPSARRRGLATWALRTMLDEAQQRGMDRVLLVCDAANTASVATIERNGGTLEHDERSPVRRYWIDL